MNSLNSNQSTFTSTVDETLSKNDDAMKEVMKDGENEKTEEEQAKSTNEVGKKTLCLIWWDAAIFLNLIYNINYIII